jgi:hypothetical protein
VSNRLNRDQLIARALDEIDSVALDAHDRPGGSVLATNAFTIAWLQDGLDTFHRIFPMAGRLTSQSITLTSTGVLTLPTDFIIDVKDGILIPEHKVRVLRKGFQESLNYDLRGITGSNEPCYYTKQGNVIRFTPRPSDTVTATLWYYALPAVLDENDVPDFPDDWTLIEYIRLRGMEHIKALPPGSAQKYVNEAIATLRSAQLFGEPEHDTFPLDPIQFPRNAGGAYDWLGSTVVGP